VGKSRTPETKARISASSGNVFADLGFPNSASELAKAELATRIAAIIEERGLSQTRAAKVLGIDQPRVSDLVRGKLGSFSLERLFRYLNVLDQNIEIVVRPRGRSRRAAIRVTTAGTGSGRRG
jgi:predicted XRE-type DNA-binding protein